jgi:predicted component of type VI protein secretion system
MKSLGLDAIHFRIHADYRYRLCFSKVFDRFFRLKIVSLLGFWRENQSGQLHFTAGSCVSERAGCKKTARSERVLSQSDCFIFTDKK